MINDLALRWIVTLLFLFSAGVCISAIAKNRHSRLNLISHSLHAVMALAMALMAWPRGAELPPRAPMIFFLIAAVWFAVLTLRGGGHRAANSYHALMMLAMSWMYAAMGGLPLRREESRASADMAGMDMAGMPGMDSSAGHAGHGGASAGMSSAREPANWVGSLNWLCTIGFTAAAAYWFYRFVTTRLQPGADDASSSIGILCQLAMAAGMAVMFGLMV